MDVKNPFLVYVGMVVQVCCQEEADVLENRLKLIETKFEKVDAILEGLEQLCSSLRITKDSEETKDEKEIDSQVPKVEEEDHLEDFVPTIKVISVESGGIVDDRINVKVIYRSENNCDIRWNVRYADSTYLALQGETQEKIIDNSTMRICAASIDILDVTNLRWFLAVIFGPDDNVQLSFNITALEEEGAEPIDEFEYKILKYSPTELVTEDMSEGIETTVEVTSSVVQDINEGFSVVYAIFSYVNTTASPPEYNEVWSFNNDNLTVEIKDNNENKIVLGVGKDLAKFGGYLSLRVEQRNIENKYLIDHKYGVGIRVLNQETNSIMPAGVIAIQKKEPVQYYSGQYYGLSCLGASIPNPDIVLFKVKPNGKMKQLRADFETKRDIIHTQVINFGPNDAEKLIGTYVCRVSLGNEFIDTKFSVTKYVGIAFDEKKTGIMKKSPKQMSIFCKASGVPAPDFELRVNDLFGEDLMKSKDTRFKHKVIKRKNNTKVTLTIKPPDPDISNITCIAKQIIEGNVGPTMSYLIDI